MDVVLRGIADQVFHEVSKTRYLRGTRFTPLIDQRGKPSVGVSLSRRDVGRGEVSADRPTDLIVVGEGPGLQRADLVGVRREKSIQWMSNENCTGEGRREENRRIRQRTKSKQWQGLPLIDRPEIHRRSVRLVQIGQVAQQCREE